MGGELHYREWGAGGRVAVLLHGLMGSWRQYHRVGPALADLGYRALAVDLPGHGGSDPDPEATFETCVEALARSVPARPAVLIGQSIGGAIGALSLDALQPERAIYVDATVGAPGEDPVPADRLAGEDLAKERARLIDGWSQNKVNRTLDGLRARRPTWTDADRLAEEASARDFDVPTGVSLVLEFRSRPPAPVVPGRSLAVFADPGGSESERRRTRAAELRGFGVETMIIPDSDHSVWYGRFEPFMDAVGTWLTRPMS
ncbi:alpha/beta fold hydrolase [Microlunatus parietis]|uniref:Pimeloyl-ACP methyl ester carboxylesterase n=1 Tax=Microlunatus parietis TaxID=682979 RepID=A0A7Y9LAN2_9ACTN|nr:alpha/beta hydrolase [Microlunatus parietis]NYE69958.1 pimeloyl-ACP methyl ester carboxylesterase [Microlunatus parietis]